MTALVVAAVIAMTPAAPVSPMCDDGSYRRAHPLICDTGDSVPGGFPSSGGGGGSRRGGLLGGLLGGLGLL